MINSRLCFRVKKANDSFFLQNVNEQKLIEWQVTNIASGKFSTIYYFPSINTKFHKEGINGRNAIIFFLLQNKAIKDCELEDKVLAKVIDKYNQPID
jgi:hypothetical protein